MVATNDSYFLQWALACTAHRRRGRYVCFTTWVLLVYTISPVPDDGGAVRQCGVGYIISECDYTFTVDTGVLLYITEGLMFVCGVCFGEGHVRNW